MRSTGDTIRSVLFFITIQALYICLILGLSFTVYYILPRYLNGFVALFVVPPLTFGLFYLGFTKTGFRDAAVLLVMGITSFTIWVPMTGILYADSITDTVLLSMKKNDIILDVSGGKVKAETGYYRLNNFRLLRDSYGLVKETSSGKHRVTTTYYYYALPAVPCGYVKGDPVHVWVYDETDSTSKEKSPFAELISGRGTPAELTAISLYDAYDRGNAWKAVRNALERHGLKVEDNPLLVTPRGTRESIIRSGVRNMKIAVSVIAAVWILIPAVSFSCLRLFRS